MITTSIGYLFVISLSVAFFIILDTKTNFKILKYIPAVVLIYAFSMLLSSFSIFDHNQEISRVYKLTKTNLLPAMLFLMLLEVDLRHFFKLGKSLSISYILAVVSISIGFIVTALMFNFNHDMSCAFGALAGSWMGGTANMVAVGSALNVNDNAFAYTLVVDSVDYTLWVMLLLFLVPFANIFNKFTKSNENLDYIGDIGCACSMGAKRYWLLIALALGVSLISQILATYFVLINHTTTVIIIATLFGLLGSFTKLRYVNGSSEVSTTMLYTIIALIGSNAVIESFAGLSEYVFAGLVILLIHAIIMIIGAKIFKLDLFSISVASLSNIGGVASAPILAATYNKSLVGVGVIMAIMGYIIGTFGGLIVGNILLRLS